jgi:hypothetical protein
MGGRLRGSRSLKRHQPRFTVDRFAPPDVQVWRVSMSGMAKLLLWPAITMALAGCGRSPSHDIAACRSDAAATIKSLSPVVEEGVRACMERKGYRLNHYTSRCGGPASPATGAVLHQDCWLAPGQVPSNYPFPPNQH